jgi:transposase
VIALQALEGRVSDHHRFLLQELMEHLEFIESKMSRLEQEIEKRLRPFEETVERLCTVPGIDRISAWGIISEIGLEMSQFPDEAHLASWAGLCPGNWESAGKRKSGRIRKGNAWLRRHLCQSAWGVSTKQNNYLSALFRARGIRLDHRKILNTLLWVRHRFSWQCQRIGTQNQFAVLTPSPATWKLWANGYRPAGFEPWRWNLPESTGFRCSRFWRNVASKLAWSMLDT